VPILSAAQGEERAVKTLEMAERRMTQAQISEAEARTRLEANCAANSPCSQLSIKGACTAAVPERATGERRGVSSLGNAMALSAASGQLTKVLLAMMRLSLI
jgi:hypothetical protein